MYIKLRLVLIPILLIFIIFFLFFYPKISFARTEYILSGKTMGTYYSVRFVTTGGESEELWQKRVDMQLRRINKIFSVFDVNSQLSLFNRQKKGNCIKVSPGFYNVLIKAQKVHSLSCGAWDGTVKPLVDLWGFGTKTDGSATGIPASGIPAPDKINNALEKIGFQHIKINKDYTICKDAEFSLDLGSIAKGFGVDAVIELFANYGIRNVLVEIGGEIMASGINKKGETWKVGISSPTKDFFGGTVLKIVSLSNKAIATSGSYQNFFEINGNSYSHIIDPRTGWPVDNAIVSASVISQSCALADGLATAMMVMNLQKSLDLADSLENTECLIVTKDGNKLKLYMSKNFEKYLEE